VEHTFAAFLDCEVQRGDELGRQTVDVRTKVYQRTRRIAMSLLARAVQRRGALEHVKREGRGGWVGGGVAQVNVRTNSRCANPNMEDDTRDCDCGVGLARPQLAHEQHIAHASALKTNP